MLLGSEVVPVFVIRHACAGDKHNWPGDDADRPLDEIGRRQAEMLAERLASAPIHRTLTSPAHRCVQTLEPLTQSLGLDIELLEELGPDGDPTYLRTLVIALDAATGAICTHGELMRPLLTSFRDNGTRILTQHDDDDWLLGKGTAWELTLDSQGAVTTLEHIAPARLPACPQHDRAGV